MTMSCFPRPLLAAFCLALMASSAMPVVAQPTPFDMTPEGGLVEAPAPAPSAPVAPSVIVPVAPTGFSRNILPFSRFQLVGEEARRSVNVYLSQAQAAAPATLDLGYVNAIVAAPEASRLAVLVNGTTVLTNPITSSTGIARLEASLPPGLLHAGANRIEFDASQRHRTDCSVASTYELWTELDPRTSVLRFEGTGLDRLTQLSDLAAIGFDASGLTTLRFVIPGKAAPAASSSALMLAQYLGLALHVSDIDVEIVDALPDTTEPGTLNIVLAVADQLPPDVAQLQAQAASGPLAAFAPAPALANTLVISGPEWGSVDAAARAVAETAPPPSAAMLPQRADLAFPIPKVDGATTFTLADLGVPTVEFNGRRYRTSFEFSLPADFYAQMYGQAQLVLDAAYSAEVLPGSQFDLYANGQIASATPVLRTDGGLFRNTRIQIPMTHFRPGRNEIEAEIILLTRADENCTPGLTQAAGQRFLFSSTTQFVMPEFGRAGTLPDLQAFAGTGAPYAGDTPTPIVIGPGEQSLPAAMTWLTRVAVAAGAAVPVTAVDATALDPSAGALVVSPLPSMPDALVGRSGVARSVGNSGAADDSALDRFNRSTGSQAGSPLETARQWIADRVGLAPDNLQLWRGADSAYVPQSADAVIVAQSQQPEGGVWTYLTTPTEAGFLANTQRLTLTDNWRAISGRVSALAPDDATVMTVPTTNPSIVQTQPFSIFNIRMVAANWLSTNVLQFTLLMAAVTIILTLATAALLRTLGRR